MSKYTIRFDRIGRTHDVPPLHTEAEDAELLAGVIYRYARKYLGSRDVNVLADLDEMRGSIICGMNNGGSFTIEHGHTVNLPIRDERSVGAALIREGQS